MSFLLFKYHIIIVSTVRHYLDFCNDIIITTIVKNQITNWHENPYYYYYPTTVPLATESNISLLTVSKQNKY